MKKSSKDSLNFRYIHIISNVIFGGGEQVLITLSKETKNQNFVYFLRKSHKIPRKKNIDNSSIFIAKDVYVSLLDHLETFLYLIFILLKIRFNHHYKFHLVLHGFPCQYSLIWARLIFPKKIILLIYHQIKHDHYGVLSILKYIEKLLIIFSKPIIGAPSTRALSSVQKYLNFESYKNTNYFEFKNCFSSITYTKKSNEISKSIITGNPYFLTVARFEDFKGHERFLNFIKNNPQLKEQFRFIFIGDGKNLKKCKTFKKENYLNNVIFLGSINRKDLFNFYSQSIGVFVPSYEESFGVSIVEALSFKKVVLVFEKSLLVDKNIKLINESSTNLSYKKIKKLLVWDENSKESIVFNSEDTMNSLNNVVKSYQDNISR